MAVFKARTEAPKTTDKNYIRYDKGGYNYCIHIKNGSCLPNCVGYAWGRWRELLGEFHKLSRANAENWWGFTADGYKRGQTPKLGAVVCWRKGKAGNEADGAGHVGIVEKITSDSVVVSMSAYGGTRWFTRTFKKGAYSYNSYVFQGFIYLPIEFEEEAEEITATDAAKSKNTAFAGTYTTTENLNIRHGAGTHKAKIVTIPKGTKVENYGYYTTYNRVKWLYVQFTYEGVTYTGFAHSGYLKK